MNISKIKFDDRENTVGIYSDGSCNTQTNIGAWASIIVSNNKNQTISGIENNTTNNRMELFSVIKSFEYIEKNISDFKKICVYSDSQYVCHLPNRMEKIIKNNFNTKSGNSIRNSDLIKILFNYIKKYNISFIKVKAHKRQDSNESKLNRYVDKLARKLVRSIKN